MTKEWKEIGIVFGIIGIFYLILFALGITCPIKAITGISCPGCGMTRAWLSLLSGDLNRAISFHPLFFYPLTLLILFFYRKSLSKKTLYFFFFFLGISFLGLYLYRMFTSTDTVVVFKPREGLIYKMLQNMGRP